MTPEGKFKSEFQAWLKTTFDQHIWLEATHHTFRRGLPDLVGIIFGRGVGFELKVNAKLEPIQKVELHRMAQAESVVGEVRLHERGVLQWTRFRANTADPPILCTYTDFGIILKDLLAR